jgi:HSP20 family protein
VSKIASPQEGSRSAIGRLLDDYDRLLTSRPGSRFWTYSPSFDVRETEDAYHLEGELPGVQSSDIDIEFENSNTVNIKGHSSRESQSKEGSWRVSERSVGEFRRTFSFPSPIDQENTQTQLKDGILTVTAPKLGSAPNTKKADTDT